METTICGNYPKIDYKKSEINLRQALNNLDAGKISQEQLQEVIKATIARTVNDQLEAGIDHITDGQIRWSDLLSPFCESVRNIRTGGLRRFFDNNIYYRRPQIYAEMRRTNPLVLDDLKIVRFLTQAPLKAVICGPITFAHSSDNECGKGFELVVEGVLPVLRQELEEVDKFGVNYIQLDEPALPLYPQFFDLAVKVYIKLLKELKAKKGIAVYFTTLKQISARLAELPLNFLALDLVSHPDENSSLPKMEKMELHAGLIDGRNIKLEDKEEVKRKLCDLRKQMNPKKILLTTSCGLEFIPRNYAIEKMKRLKEIASSMSE